MCGIIGGIHSGGIRRLLFTGLSRLEYRGYDSAGIAVSDGAEISRVAVVGRVAALRQRAAQTDGNIGIGHTRWATHGVPADNNAHPIRAGAVLVVHNGIIENHAALRRELTAAGRCFGGETDSEVIAHLLDDALQREGDLLRAFRIVLKRLQGAYALAAMIDGMPDIICARQGSPLLLAEGDDGVFLASDAQALAGVARRVRYLDNGEHALLKMESRQEAKIVGVWNAQGDSVAEHWTPLTVREAEVQLGDHRHFMQKEIFAQPDATAATMERYVGAPELSLRRFGAGAARVFRRVKQISVIACGTSYHAGMVARHWLEELGVPCKVEIASEYRYRRDPLAAASLVLVVSQSGETADTLSAMRAAKEAGATTLAIVNNADSSMARESDLVFPVRAGMEISVAATKSFTAQLTALLLLALAVAKARGNLSQEKETLASLRLLPHLLQKALLLEDDIEQWARALTMAKSALYIGRGAHYPMALEGALKLKEISYIHAEGIAAGELKHGSLALVDDAMPVIGLAADGSHEKMAASLSEVATRGGRLFVLAGGEYQVTASEQAKVLRLPDDGGRLLSPIVYAVPLQLLAYHTARLKGTDIDKPRNLAKSVTVE